MTSELAYLAYPGKGGKPSRVVIVELHLPFDEKKSNNEQDDGERRADGHH